MWHFFFSNQTTMSSTSKDKKDKAAVKALKKARKESKKKDETVHSNGMMVWNSKKEKDESNKISGETGKKLSEKDLRKLQKREAKKAAKRALIRLSEAHELEANRVPKKTKENAPSGEEGIMNGFSSKKQKKMAKVGDFKLASIRPPLLKNLYSECEELASMSCETVAKWRAERCTTIEGIDMKPLMSFGQSGLTEDELHSTKDFASPSPIQAQCLPIALSGYDVVGIAATGSGKTLAFGLPALKHVRMQTAASGAASGKKPVALVLAPTRELAQQISTVLENAGSRVGIRTLCVYGGVPKRDQVNALRRENIGIIVATPGRLEDLVSEGACALDEISYLVLDEADRMLDLGFEPHIRSIASATRADRQTLMFSATWPPEIRKLASEFLCEPVKVTIGSKELAASHSVKQIVEVVEDRSRDQKLQELLNTYHGNRSNRIIVFVLYKKEAARVESLLVRRGWNATAVHGDVSQAQRTAAVEAFRQGKTPLLVATDVAARGLDIPDVEVVINYSFPLTTEDYVHRIGRTGRAGKSGIAHTLFVGAHDKPRAGELVNVLREANQPVPGSLLAFGTAVKKKESKLYGAHFKEIDPTRKATKVTFDSDED